jgi:hypothetical protein
VLLLLAVPTIPYVFADLWRVVLMNPDLFGLRSWWLDSPNLAWMALLLVVVLLAVLAPRPAAQFFPHARGRPDQGR